MSTRTARQATGRRWSLRHVAILGLVAIAVSIAAAGIASASSLRPSIGGKDVASGVIDAGASTLTCNPAGVTTAFTYAYDSTSPYNDPSARWSTTATGVVVGSIPASCGGWTIEVRVTRADGTVNNTGVVTLPATPPASVTLQCPTAMPSPTSIGKVLVVATKVARTAGGSECR